MTVRMQDIDTGACSARCAGAGQPGENLELFPRPDGGAAAVVAGDAAGGLRGSVMAGMVLSMFRSALSHGRTIEQAADMVQDILPGDGTGAPVPWLAVQLERSGSLYLAATDSLPAPLFLRRGRAQAFAWSSCRRNRHPFLEKRARLLGRDTLVCLGGGVAHAGAGAAAEFAEAVPGADAWCGHLLPAYLEAVYTPSVPAQKLAELTVNASREICGGHPGFALNVCVLRYGGNGR